MQNVVGPTLVAMATKFGLGAEIQLPTGLYNSFTLTTLSTLRLRSVKIILTNEYIDEADEITLDCWLTIRRRHRYILSSGIKPQYTIVWSLSIRGRNASNQRENIDEELEFPGSAPAASVCIVHAPAELYFSRDSTASDFPRRRAIWSACPTELIQRSAAALGDTTIAELC